MELLPDDVYAASLNRKRTASGALFRHADGRVLLVKPSYRPYWQVPGGTGEEGEAPWETARREVLEEIGLDRALGPLLLLEYVPAAGVFPEALMFVFDGGLLTDAEVAAIAVDGVEIVAAELLTPDQVADRAPDQAQVITAALAALGGPPVLAHSGRPLD